jgi:hypothetical protein
MDRSDGPYTGLIQHKSDLCMRERRVSDKVLAGDDLEEHHTGADDSSKRSFASADKAVSEAHATPLLGKIAWNADKTRGAASMRAGGHQHAVGNAQQASSLFGKISWEASANEGAEAAGTAAGHEAADTTVQVSGIAKETGVNALKSFFQDKVGGVTSARMLSAAELKTNAGRVASVSFESKELADRAVSTMNGKQLDGRYANAFMRSVF